MWAARSRSAPSTPRLSSPPAGCALPPSREWGRRGSDNNSAFANDATSPPGLTRGSILFAEGFLQRRWIDGSSPAMTIQRTGITTAGLSLRVAVIGAISKSFSACSLRLAAQDVALSRRKQGFESPRERQRFQRLSDKLPEKTLRMPTFCLLYPDLWSRHVQVSRRKRE